MASSSVNILGTVQIFMPLVWLVGMVAFFVVGIILWYHWRKYSVDRAGSRRFVVVYTIVGLLFLCVMAVSMFLI